MLLGVVAVGAERRVPRRLGAAAVGEGVGEGARGRGRVRLGGVVDGGWTRRLEIKVEYQDKQVGKNSQGVERGPMNLMRGVRSAWAAACRRARVANMATVVVAMRAVVFRGLESAMVGRRGVESGNRGARRGEVEGMSGEEK